MAVVLVTGGSGFVGSHCVLQLLNAGHAVRTTVRSREKQDRLARILERQSVDAAGRLTFCQADLLADTGWREAAAGCDYVLHVASPFPSIVPKDGNELVAPARDGTLRVLRAARDGGVRRVVLTSSFAAIGYGHPHRPTPFTEEDWTNLDDPGVQPYQRSKTLAERAAWQLIAEGRNLELAVINPVGVLGPALGPDYSTSILIVKRLLDGSVPGCPDLWFGVVDVRDVAGLHLLAMANPAARGERFLATAGDFVSVLEVAMTLKEALGSRARKVPTRPLPSWLLRLTGLFDRQVKGVIPEIGKRKNASSEKARRLLGWSPRSPREAIIAAARSVLELGPMEGS